VVTARPLQAQTARSRETPRGLNGQSPDGIEPIDVPWHDTYIYWDNAVTASTLGVGQDYLTRNPLYDHVRRSAALLLRRQRASHDQRARRTGGGERAHE